MRSFSLLSVGLLSLAACTARGDQSITTLPDSAVGDTPTSDAPASDMPGSDVLVPDVPVTDAAVDAPADVPAADVPATDVPTPDAPPPMDVPMGGTSAQIEAVRVASPGGASLRIEGALVTFTVPVALRPDGTASANDPAGFFVQADRMGPALFVAVDPATLSPRPSPGDRVTFTVNRVIMSPTAPTRWVTEISGYTRQATGVPLAPLVQTVSAANDLVSALPSYEYELVAAEFTITDDFAAAGVGFVQAPIATAALPADPGLRFRLPADLRATLNLRAGCRVSVNATPLWRFDVTAQPSAWYARDIVSASCPTPPPDAGVDVAPDLPVDVAPDLPRDVAPDLPPDVPVTTDDRVWALRVGDGSAALTNAAVPVFLDGFDGVTGATLGASIAMPTETVGSNLPLTLSGNASGEGTLSRSVDGRYLTLIGYSLPVGTANVNSTVGARVIARVDASRVVDTRTSISGSWSSMAARAAVTVDGSAFWTVHVSSSTGDVVYTPYLGTLPTAVTTRLVLRTAMLFNNQLLATASIPEGYGVFATATLPRAAATPLTLLPGFPTTVGPSPYGVVAFDRDGNGAPDVLFVADDRTITAGGGLQLWRLSGGTWVMSTLTSDLTNGLRGLTGRTQGSDYVLYATTSESRARLLRLQVSAAGLTVTSTAIATAPMNTTWRGVAFAPR